MIVYIDCSKRKPVRSLTDSQTQALKFCAGDRESLEIHFLDPDGIDALYKERILAAGDIVKAGLGIFTPEKTVYTVSAECEIGESGGAILKMPLNTTVLYEALSGKQSIQGYFEVEHTSGDVITTLLQESCTITNELISDTPPIELQPGYYDKESADARFLKTSENLSDISDPAEARENLGAAAAADLEIKADKADTYTKAEVNNALNEKADNESLSELSADFDALEEKSIANSSNFAALCRRAANVGFFQFDGGNAALAKAISSLPLSIAFMFQKTGDIANYTLYAGNNALGNASNTGICIAKNNGDTSVVQLRTESGGTLSQGYFNDTSLLDGKLHSVVVIVTDKLSLYIDGLAVSFSSGSWTGISASEIATPRTFYVGNGSGYALSRVKIFNFDMTAEGAPYTVADYAAGIEPSPVLMLGTPATTDPTMGASTGEGWTQGAVSNTTGTSGDWKFGNRTTYIKNRELSQSDYDGGLPADITSAVDFKTEYAIGVSLATSMLYDAVDFERYAGTSQKCRVSFWLRNNAAETSTSVDGMAIGMGYNKALQLKLSERDKYPFNQWVLVDEIVDFTFPSGLAAWSMRIGISAHGTPNGSDLYGVSIADFKFEVIGANLALSDAADASQIRDKSGNGNHALISGAVLPSKGNNPAHCAQTITWAGTSTLQNVCGDSAIPANSKVTAYAKATGAVTASFKAGAWAAQSKDLAANALTEIGSWLCGASGAFSVQPSAAYTGSIETYLTIERL